MNDQNTCWMWIGTRNSNTTEAMNDNNVPRSHGIYVSQFDSVSGKIDGVRLVAEMMEANFFALDKERKLLYVCGRRDLSSSEANLYAFRINDQTGDLSLLNSRSTEGRAICHVSLDPLGQFAAVANYLTGNYALFRLEKDGRLGDMTDLVQMRGGGPNKKRQDSAKAHAIYFYRRNEQTRLFLVDLGSDKIYIMILNEETGQLSPDPDCSCLNCPPGSGPRHLTWMETNDGNGLVLFVLNELRSTLSAFLLLFAHNGNITTDTDHSISKEYDSILSKNKECQKNYQDNIHDNLSCFSPIDFPLHLYRPSKQLSPEQRIETGITLGTWEILPKDFREKVSESQSNSFESLSGSFAAEIELKQTVLDKSPNQSFLYISHRGHNTITVLDVQHFREITRRRILLSCHTARPSSLEITNLIEPMKPIDSAILSMKQSEENVSEQGINSYIPKFHQSISTYGNCPRFFSFDPTERYLVVCNTRSGTLLTYSCNICNTCKESGPLHLAENEPVRVAWPFAVAFYSNDQRTRTNEETNGSDV